MTNPTKPGIGSERFSLPLDLGAVSMSPPLPGGVGLTHLRVYDSIAPDGLIGGTPHCHTVCTEAYFVIAGSGRVMTLGGDGLKETPIEPGSLVWFIPGTIHRLLNDGGDLEILVVMQNSGLPEAGDMVLTMPDELLADPEQYRSAATLPVAAATTTADDAAARARRDQAVKGFGAIVEGGPEALARFHQRAAQLVLPNVEKWRSIWERGAAAAAEATDHQLAALASGDPSHLASSSVHSMPPAPEERRYGCCGTLGTYVQSTELI